MEKETQKLTNQLVVESHKVLNQQLNDIVQVSTMLFTNQKMFDLLNQDKSNDEYENYKRQSEIQDILRNVTNARLDIQTVTVISEEGDMISTGAMSSDKLEPHKTDWFKEAIEADGKLIWFPTNGHSLVDEGQKQWTYALARSINSLGGGKFVFLIEVRETALSNLLKEMEVSQSGTLRVVDQEGKVVSSLNEKELGTTKPSKNYSFLDHEEPGSVIEDQQLISYAPLESTGWYLVVEVPLSAMLAQVKQIRTFTIIAIAISAVVAITVAVFMGGQFARPLEQMRHIMKRAGEGNLTARADIPGKHEIAQLNRSYTELMDRFRQFVGRTKEAGDDLKAVADDLIKQAEQNNVTYREITEATGSIAAGADQQAREAETSAELVGELLSKWRESLGEAEKLEQVMNDTVDVSEEGRNSIRELLEKNESTEQELKRLSDNLESLEDRVDEVHNATNLIDDIMDQTKILALNAAIEAHRAGQDGRGFIVVADEIQRLSEQVLSATNTIGDSIEAIEQAMKHTWNSMKLTNEAMDLQNKTVSSTDVAFHRIREQMNQAANQLTSVMNTLSLVQQFEQRMSDAIQNISAVAEQSAAATEEVAALAKDQERSADHLVTQSHSLGEVVHTLEEELRQFQVEESDETLDTEVMEDMVGLTGAHDNEEAEEVEEAEEAKKAESNGEAGETTETTVPDEGSVEEATGGDSENGIDSMKLEEPFETSVEEAEGDEDVEQVPDVDPHPGDTDESDDDDALNSHDHEEKEEDQEK